MEHNIEGDIRNCIEVANYDYSLSHLDEPMLNYYNELVSKAKAFDEILKIDLAQHDEEYADNVMKVVNKYTEEKQND